MDATQLRFVMGLGQIPKIGPVLARRLIDTCGGAENVFAEKRPALAAIPGIGDRLAEAISGYRIPERIDREIEYISRHNIKALFYQDEEYPDRLRNCEDAPVLLFVMGSTGLHRSRVISIVGTRSPTDYGRNVTRDLIAELACTYPDVLVISGLAYGIDICAHRAALKNGIDTAAVLGHGLSMIYPAMHRETAAQMVAKGALVTEFLHDDKPEAPNFVRRNRIIAGLADATIVIESGIKGGALITADLAASYNRDVMAVPGRTADARSKGCNLLIKTNKAALLESLHDLEYLLGWQQDVAEKKAIQPNLFDDLNDYEKILLDILGAHERLTVDQLALLSSMAVSRVSSLLLNLECRGLVRCLPGKVYKMMK